MARLLSAAVLLALLLAVAADLVPNREFEFDSRYAYIGEPNILTLSTNIQLTDYVNVTLACDDPLASFPSRLEILTYVRFNITLFRYAGLDKGTMLTARLDNGTLVAAQVIYVVAWNASIVAPATVKVNQPFPVTITLLDRNNQPIPAPYEYLSVYYNGAGMTGDFVGAYAGGFPLVNQTAQVFYYAFSTYGLVQLTISLSAGSNAPRDGILASGMTRVVPVAGDGVTPLPMPALSFQAGFQACFWNRNCTLFVSPISTATGKAPVPAYNGTLLISCTDPGATHPASAAGSNDMQIVFRFQDYTGDTYVYPPINCTITDSSDSTSTRSLPVTVLFSSFVWLEYPTAPVSVGQTFRVTYGLDIGNGSLVPADPPESLATEVSGPDASLDGFATWNPVDPYAYTQNASGMVSFQISINRPGAFGFHPLFFPGFPGFDSPSVFVLPTNGAGAQIPLPAGAISVYMDAYAAILGEPMSSYYIYIWNNTAADANWNSYNGTVHVTSSDPTMTGPTSYAVTGSSFTVTRYNPFSTQTVAFHQYTGNASATTLTFADPVAGMSVSYQIHVYAQHRFVFPPSVAAGVPFTVQVVAVDESGAVLLNASDPLVLRFTYKNPEPFSHAGDIATKAVQTTVNGLASFCIAINTPGVYQFSARPSTATASFADYSLSDFISVGTGNALVPPAAGTAAPTQAACVFASPAPTSSAPSGSPSGTAAGTNSPGGGSGSSFPWYIPVAAVLGALVLVGAGIGLYFLLRKNGGGVGGGGGGGGGKTRAYTVNL